MLRYLLLGLFALLCAQGTVWAQEISLAAPPRSLVVDMEKNLIQRVMMDQNVRKEYQRVWKDRGSLTMKEWRKKRSAITHRAGKIDRANAEYVRSILCIWGWPSIGRFSKKIDKDIWLLVQHSPYELQKFALSYLEQALDRGDTDPRNVAYLTDRVRMKECRCQIYGTQTRVDEKTGCPRLQPLSDPKAVDMLRKAHRLPTLEKEFMATQKTYRVGDNKCFSGPFTPEKVYGVLSCKNDKIEGWEKILSKDNKTNQSNVCRERIAAYNPVLICE